MSAAAPRRIAVLGTGRVGSLVVRDLARDPALSVLACDGSEHALDRLGDDGRVERRRLDLNDPGALRVALTGVDVAIGAVPGSLGHGLLARLIDLGLPTVDIAFAPEDPFALDAAAQERGVPVVVDCGVAPGLSNWFVGHSLAELEGVERVEILVGGLPFRRVWPWEYRSVFSPTDVIEEYTRPCRMRLGGTLRTVPALSGVERVEFPGVGTLEAFNTDGLRTLLDTCGAPDLVEKTLRYPGHAERMEMLRAAGFFDERPLEVGAASVAPRALTEALLFRAWEPGAGEEEFTVLRVRVEGRSAGGPRLRHEWHLFDRTDPVDGTSSMARTTGFPCALVARLLADRRWERAGVFAPEHLAAEPGLTAWLLDGLAERDVRVECSVRELGEAG